MRRSALLRIPAVLLLVQLLNMPVAQAQGDLAQQAKAILERHCYVCHGKEGIQEAGLHVLDWKRLTSNGEARKAEDAPVVPSQPIRSNLLSRMQDGSAAPRPGVRRAGQECSQTRCGSRIGDPAMDCSRCSDLRGRDSPHVHFPRTDAAVRRAGPEEQCPRAGPPVHPVLHADASLQRRRSQ